MRKQYHLRPSEQGLLAWDIDRLIRLTRDLPVEEIPISSIRELDEPYWYGPEGETPTCRAIAMHAQLIAAADLSWPIILSSNGRVMDGMHRVVKGLIEKEEYINAVRFTVDPEPDFIGIPAHALPYEEA